MVHNSIHFDFRHSSRSDSAEKAEDYADRCNSKRKKDDMKVVLYNWHDFREAALWLIHGQWALSLELSAMVPESRPVKNFDHGARIIIFFWTLQNRWQRWQKKYLRALTEGVMPDLLPKVPSIITLNNYNKEPWSLFIESFTGVLVLWIQGNSCIQFKTTVPGCLLRVITSMVSGCLVNSAYLFKSWSTKMA